MYIFAVERLVSRRTTFCLHAFYYVFNKYKMNIIINKISQTFYFYNTLLHF